MSSRNSTQYLRTAYGFGLRSFSLGLWLTTALIAAGASAADAKPEAAWSTEPARENGRREVVFIDTSVANPQDLAKGVDAGVEVRLFGGEADGLAQMARWARTHRGYDAIHVISHGAPGAITLGAATMDDALLNRSEVQAELADIGRALNNGGDLFLYGCRVAEGARGRAFVRQLAAATGAHVAASTNPTGSARLGGDWTLEYATAATPVRALAAPAYDGLLGSGTIVFSPSDGATFGVDGLVTDGEWSVDIPGIVIQVAAVDGSNAILTGDYLAFHRSDWGLPGDGIVTWEKYDVSSNPIPSHGMVIQSADGSEFQINGFQYINWGEGAPITVEVRGYKDTDEVASTSFTTIPGGGWQVASVTLGSSFDDVDQVILYSASDSWHGINNIVIADAVAPPTTTITGASLSADTGYSNTDWITSTALQTISGTLSANLVAGEKVQISYDNGTNWSDATSAVGSNTWSAATTLSGSNTFLARVYNASSAGTAWTKAYVLDQTAPTVTSVMRFNPATAVTNADTLVFQVTFGEALTNLRNASTGDFAVSGTTATVASVNTADVDSYNVTISGGNLASLNGTVTLSFSGAQNIVDLAGNALNTTVTGTNNNTYTLDNTGPTITSILRQNPAASLTNANSVVFRVTFGETVSNVTNADFAASGTTATASVSAVAGDTYDVTLSGGNLAALDGTVSLGLAIGQDIADAVGNVLTDTTPTGLTESYTLDNTAPGGCAGALSVAENAPNGTAVGTVVASDAHAVAYSLTDTAGGRFAVSAGGAVTVANGSLLDYEAATSHSITIRATDAAGNISDTIRDVTITNVNDIWPVITEGAGPLAVTMSEDSSPTAFALTLHATDADGPTTFTWSILSSASHGTASASGTGSAMGITYLPTANYNGSDSFIVQVSDGINTDSVQVNVTIQSVNDAPIINQGASTSFTMAEDTAHDLTLGATDVDGQPLNWSLTSAPVHGGLGFAGGTAASKTFTYTPDANYSGPDAFSVTVSDGTLTDTIDVTVTVSAVNDPPVINEGASTSFSTAEDTGHDVALTATDPEGDAVTWSIASSPAHGTATVPTGTGTSKSVTYTPSANYNGSDSFVVAASDGSLSDAITVNVTVTAVNDGPAITEGSSTTLSLTQDTSSAVTLNATDSDGDTLTWSITTPATHGTASASGTGGSKSVDYTPEAGYVGSDSFVVTVSDGALSDTITVNVTVTALITSVEAPVLSRPAGAYAKSVAVQLSSRTATASIRYTTDYSRPTATHGTLIANGDLIILNRTTHLRAVAFTGSYVSPETEADYTITDGGGGAFSFGSLGLLALLTARRRLRAG